MEKEPKPFSEEKAKEIMEAEGYEERSQAEQDAFEAGKRKGTEIKDEEESKQKIKELERIGSIIKKALNFKNQKAQIFLMEAEVFMNI